MTTATATASKYETLRYGLGRVKVGSLSLSDQGLTSLSPPRIARSLVFLSFPAMRRWIVKYFLQARPLRYLFDGQNHCLADILVPLTNADVHRGIRFTRNRAVQFRL
jgi:hypothetical protein